MDSCFYIWRTSLIHPRLHQLMSMSSLYQFCATTAVAHSANLRQTTLNSSNSPLFPATHQWWLEIPPLSPIEKPCSLVLRYSPSVSLACLACSRIVFLCCSSSSRKCCNSSAPLSSSKWLLIFFTSSWCSNSFKISFGGLIDAQFLVLVYFCLVTVFIVAESPIALAHLQSFLCALQMIYRAIYTFTLAALW